MGILPKHTCTVTMASAVFLSRLTPGYYPHIFHFFLLFIVLPKEYRKAYYLLMLTSLRLWAGRVHQVSTVW